MKNYLIILLFSIFAAASCNTPEEEADVQVNDNDVTIIENNDSIINNDTLIAPQTEVITEDTTPSNKPPKKEEVVNKKENENPNTTTKEKLSNECAPDLVCTGIFKTQFLTIKDKNGKAVALDSYNIYYGGSTLGVKKLMDKQNGKYTLVDDNVIRILPQKGSTITFKGFINNKEVVNHKVKVNHDCCHITSVEGNQNITISL